MHFFDFASAAVNGEIIAPQLIMSDLHVRLQTHMGDNVPVGLFQDAALTTPATEEGDRVGGWRDMWVPSDAAFVAVTQTDNALRPTLTFVGGVPHLYFAAGQFLIGDMVAWTLDRALVICGFTPDDVASYTLFDIGAGTDTWTTDTDNNGSPQAFSSARKDDIHLGTLADPFLDYTLAYYSADGVFTAWLDGTQEGTTAVNTFLADTGEFVIGNSYAQGANPAKNYAGLISSFFVSHKLTDRSPLDDYVRSLF